MNKPNSQTAAAWPEKTFAAAADARHRAGQQVSSCPDRMRVDKSPLRCGMGWIKVTPRARFKKSKRPFKN
jgi:hypothetical protein